jgi:2-(3-amino-3-carboxypropyl)histidine synthase|tara:strand:+ start:860 stop:1471 length:612 start_codon:yes stop_codon:yes gene_type:complete
MKILYIESKQKNLKAELSKSEIVKLPKKIFLAYSIQYKDLSYNIAKQLKKSKIKIEKTQQVLGCSKVNTKLPILLIGTGRFHAQNLYLQTPILYILENNKIIKISKDEINRLKARKKTALIKFLKADNIGILVSTKPGQENLKQAEVLKKKLENKNKKKHIFISNNIDINQFENFNIQSWVNTACPGLANDSSDIINIGDIPQ